MSGFMDELNKIMNEIEEVSQAANSGVSALLVGQKITGASIDVWDGDGNWSIGLTFEDGSTISVPGTTYATGPLADLVRMAGGQPNYIDGDDS